MPIEDYEIKEILWNGQRITVCVFDEEIPETTGPPLHVRYREKREEEQNHKKQHGKASIFWGSSEV
jgi:hypothetical protein